MSKSDFNWKKAEADIEERGGDLDRLYTRNDKHRDSYLREMDLNPNRYKTSSSSSSSSNTSQEGCYIATCVYGSYDSPEVRALRRFRDEKLKKNALGRAFVRAYYWVSPKLVKWFGENRVVRTIWKKGLDRIVMKIKKEEDKVIDSLVMSICFRFLKPNHNR